MPWLDSCVFAARYLYRHQHRLRSRLAPVAAAASVVDPNAQAAVRLAAPWYGLASISVMEIHIR